MSEYNSSQYHDKYHCNEGCEFVIPIKLVIPVEINPMPSIIAPAPVSQDLKVHLQPNIDFCPEVGIKKPNCLTENQGFSKYKLNSGDLPKALQSS